MTRCNTCFNRPLYGCSIFGHQGGGCFVICPECGREGFNEPKPGFVPDLELARALRERLDKWKEVAV